MTSKEVEILLKSVYKGDGATKALSDLDKISASGTKLSGVFNQVNKTLGGNAFANPSASFIKRNPHLFQSRSGASLEDDKFLRQGAKQLAGMGPLFPKYGGPTPPVIPPGGGGAGGASGAGGFVNMFFNRLASRAIGIASGIIVYKALNAAMLPLVKTVKGLNDAFENARNLYAKALTSGGLGLGFTAKREALASIIGVSSKDVYQFGQAVLFLSPRLRSANDIIAKTTPNLTATSYEFKILQYNLEALFAVMADQGASTVRKFTSTISLMIRAFTEGIQKHQKLIADISSLLTDAVINSLPPAIQAVARSLKTLVANAPDSGPAPQPMAYMKQIQASAWERMGLIVGGLGGSNPAVETARNTKQTADGVRQLVRSVGGKGTFYDPFAGTQSYQ